jgi:tetratricopeptide (TPR) repeat protein
MILLAMMLQAAPAAADPQQARFERCADLATGDGTAGQADATNWALSGTGSFLARQCLGLAYATQGRYAAAAGAFEDAARGADAAKDKRAANYWAQAGNAWLAAGDPTKARTSIDAALAGGLSGLALGEAHLDRARVLVAAGDATAARADIDTALVEAAGDPLAWLLSATLARRTGALKRAQADIAQALEKASDDAAVQLEAGNIAALAGDEAGARGGWAKAVQLGGATPVAASARAALAQFEAGK